MVSTSEEISKLRNF